MPCSDAFLIATRRSSPTRRGRLLANTAWAFTTVGLSCVPLFVAVAQGAERRLFDFNARDLANTAWAFAAAGESDATVFVAVARAAERRLSVHKSR